MTLIAWTDVFLTNVRELDDEHRRLVDLVNLLHLAVRENRGREAVAEVVAGLIEYTQNHFAHEERLMTAHGYPDLPRHRGEHQRLTRQVLGFQPRLEGESAGRATMELLVFLHGWLIHHILAEDKRYGPFLNERGVY